jgi:hypothetical protein
MPTEPLTAIDPEPLTTPRRQVLRSLFGTVVGVAALIGLAACGGEGGGEGDDEEEDD